MIAILGGGVAGAALARALAHRGRRDVVVLDPNPMGSGSTTRAFGGFRTQHGSEINVALALASRPFFEARAGRIGFLPVGYLYLATSQEWVDELASRTAFQRSLGLPVEHPEPRSLVPFLQADGVVATNYCALDGVYRPDRILACLIEEATACGVEFRYGSPAGAAEVDGADAVAVCAGAWSAEAGRSVGVELGVAPLERGIFQVGPFDWLTPSVPITLEIDTGYHFRERDGRLLVIGPGDQHEWSHYREWLARFVPEAAVERPETHWTGFYEMTFDHHPLIGATGRDGVWACCGFSGHGVMQSPAVADGLAAMMLGDTPQVDLSPLSPLRTEPLVDRTQL